MLCWKWNYVVYVDEQNHANDGWSSLSKSRRNIFGSDQLCMPIAGNDNPADAIK